MRGHAAAAPPRGRGECSGDRGPLPPGPGDLSLVDIMLTSDWLQTLDTLEAVCGGHLLDIQGDSTASDGLQLRLLRLAAHRDFDPRTFSHDIAAIFTQAETSETLAPACLPTPGEVTRAQYLHTIYLYLSSYLQHI